MSYPIDWILINTTTPSLSGPESNSNEEVATHSPRNLKLEPHHMMQLSVILRSSLFEGRTHTPLHGKQSVSSKPGCQDKL